MASIIQCKMCNKIFAILRDIFHFDPFRALHFILVGITEKKHWLHEIFKNEKKTI